MDWVPWKHIILLIRSVTFVNDFVNSFGARTVPKCYQLHDFVNSFGGLHGSFSISHGHSSRGAPSREASAELRLVDLGLATTLREQAGKGRAGTRLCGIHPGGRIRNPGFRPRVWIFDGPFWAQNGR